VLSTLDVALFIEAVEETSHTGGVARCYSPARKPERERAAAKQNKVTVLVLGAVDVAFNTSVCYCCYASQ
jgi:hypothetical protein